MLDAEQLDPLVNLAAAHRPMPSAGHQPHLHDAAAHIEMAPLLYASFLGFG